MYSKGSDGSSPRSQARFAANSNMGMTNEEEYGEEELYGDEMPVQDDAEMMESRGMIDTNGKKGKIDFY